jgi:hypothetical protein
VHQSERSEQPEFAKLMHEQRASINPNVGGQPEFGKIDA